MSAEIPEVQPVPAAAAPGTGDPAVDAAVARLRALGPESRPADQLPVLVEVHESLQQRLSGAAE